MKKLTIEGIFFIIMNTDYTYQSSLLMSILFVI